METKYVTDDDKKRYHKFGSHHFKGLASKRVPFPPLFHYTNGENLIKIIQSGELWATQIACLNDTKELVHAVDVLADAIAQRQKQSLDKDFATLLEKMNDLLGNAEPDVTGVFVSCFSERFDDLSQWRAYGGSSGSYALQFEVESILQYVSKYGGYIVPVTYDQPAKNILMADILKWSEKFMRDGISSHRAPSTEEWIDEFASCWLEQLSYLAPLLKHDAFEDEQEWRLIYYLKDTDVDRLEFTERPSMMRRHLPMRFSNPNEHGYTPLPLSGVTVGPKTYQKLTRVAVGDLLRSKGYSSTQVPVRLSRIPFRTSA